MSQAFSGLGGGPDLVDLLAESDIDRSSLILVTGGGGLSALLWLCRRGFQRVGYLKPGYGPSEPADALVVAHGCDELSLRRLLVTGPHVREGGVIVFQSPLPATAGPDPIHGALAAHGYQVERCLHGARRELHVARRLLLKRLAPQQRAA